MDRDNCRQSARQTHTEREAHIDKANKMSDLKPYKYTSALHIATNLWDPKISHKQWTITVDHGTVQSADYLRIENQY